MTNAIAAVLALMIIALFAVDHFWLHLGLPLFLARQFAQLIEYVSFWR